jgi:hypothetical protein
MIQHYIPYGIGCAIMYQKFRNYIFYDGKVEEFLEK